MLVVVVEDSRKPLSGDNKDNNDNNDISTKKRTAQSRPLAVS
jgi:hypothetical protein